MPRDSMSAALHGCYVISLRPVGGHAAIRRAAAAHGARVLGLAPWRLVARDDAGTRDALFRALRAPNVLYTSPAAVSAAAALAQLPTAGAIAVGSGTAGALRRAGVDAVAVPERMDSEGLLALPALRAAAAARIGLVTAPGGRGLVAATLGARGFEVLRADVYERVATAPSAAAVARLRALAAPLWLVLSSGEALDAVLPRLPPDVVARLRTARVVAASERLERLARARGFPGIVRAASAVPRAMLAAAAAAGAGPTMAPSDLPQPRP